MPVYPDPPSWTPAPLLPYIPRPASKAPHRLPTRRIIVTPVSTTLADLAMRYRHNSRDTAVFRRVNPGLPDVIPAGTTVVIP